MHDNFSILAPPNTWNDSGINLSTIKDPWYKLIYQCKTTLIAATHHFYEKEGIDPIVMPITCRSISSPMGLGSDSMPVRVELFGESVYLADSMQFQLEYILRNSMKGVYYIMPTFRGENHSKRHLNQFVHSEVEIYGDLKDIMLLAEKYVMFLSKILIEKLGRHLVEAGFDIIHIKQLASSDNEIPRIAFKDIENIIGSDSIYFEELGYDIRSLSHHGEAALMDAVGGICWVTHFPKKSVPFYQANEPGTDKALCADLLMGIGEVLGCGQRNRTLDETLTSLEEHQVDHNEYEWYMYLKKEFPELSSGFGLGVERFLLWVLKHNDIRDIPLINRLKGQVNMP